MVNMTNYEEYMLLYADRELSKEDELALLAFVQQHPELQAELDTYAATILQPDTTLVYEHKEALMKSSAAGRTIWPGNWKTYTAAASVILIVLLFALNRNGEKHIEQPVVIEKTVTEPITKPIPEDSVAPSPWERAGGEASLAQNNNTNHISPPKAGGKGERVHSTKPVNTVAVETKRNKIEPKPVKTQPTIQEPTKTLTEEIAKAAPDEIINDKQPKPVVAVKTAPATQPVEVPALPVEDIITEAPVKKKTRFMASVLGNKPELLDGLETAVNDKIVIAKNVRDQLKDTDVTFKIGKKELFTVRL